MIPLFYWFSCLVNCSVFVLVFLLGRLVLVFNWFSCLVNWFCCYVGFCLVIWSCCSVGVFAWSFWLCHTIGFLALSISSVLLLIVLLGKLVLLCCSFSFCPSVCFLAWSIGSVGFLAGSVGSVCFLLGQLVLLVFLMGQLDLFVSCLVNWFCCSYGFHGCSYGSGILMVPMLGNFVLLYFFVRPIDFVVFLAWSIGSAVLLCL